MKKIFFIVAFIFVSSFTSFPSLSFAQGMMGNTVAVSDGYTAREEAEGKAVWEKFQAKKLACKDFSDDNFGTLGEYFVGQMMGASHGGMNNMMIQMMGGQGEEQMHVVMGKRLSGCDASASFPAQGTNFMPMIQMLAPYQSGAFGSGMMGGLPVGQAGWSSPLSSNQLNNSMMNFGFGSFGGFGWIFMVLWWVLIIAGIVALIKWLINQSHNTHDHEKSPVEILKERYAKGEIDKKEFEDKKKDLS